MACRVVDGDSGEERLKLEAGLWNLAASRERVEPGEVLPQRSGVERMDDGGRGGGRGLPALQVASESLQGPERILDPV